MSKKKTKKRKAKRKSKQKATKGKVLTKKERKEVQEMFRESLTFD